MAMKRISLSIVLGLLIGFGISIRTQAQEKTDETSSPSLEDSISWLKEKIANYGGYTQEKPDGSKTSRKFENVSFDGCTLKYRDSSISQFKLQTVLSMTMDNQFSLADLDSEKTVVDNKDGQPTIRLYTINGEKKVKSDFRMGLPGRSTSTTVIDKEVYFPFSDADLAQRAAKAFKHIITLCRKQKTKEPF
jgi:hypothetical protein